MRKYVFLILMAALMPFCAAAQSSMTDDQVFKYIVKEHQEGTSQQQIGIQLIQRGVDVTQLRRVRQKYERLAKEQGLGVMSNSTESADDRTRKKKTQGYDGQYNDKVTDITGNQGIYNSGMRIKDDVFTSRTFDEDDDEYNNFLDELNECQKLSKDSHAAIW